MYNIKNTGGLILETHSKKIQRQLPSVFTEQRRDMTSTSALGGKYKFSNSPYTREIHDFFDDNNPYKYMSVIKVPQSGLTAMLENMLCWSIDQSPCPIMILSGDDDLSEDVVEKRFDAAIDSCGLRYKIQPSTKKEKNKRTGDTKSSKEFEGGWVVFGSANNKKNFRQRSIKRGVLDDADAAKSEDTTEGAMLKLFFKRFTWYANRGMKACIISTPTIKGHSNIELSHNKSDKREYNVPCPHCGSFIVLEFQKKIKEERFGLIFQIDRFNKLVEDSVEYRCYECGEHFKEEKNKYEMLNSGVWVPTNEEKAEPLHAGYHIGGLMLPPGTLSWKDQARDFVDCYPNGFGQPANVANLKVFVNQVEGKTYEEKGVEVSTSQLQKNNTREYEINVLPCQQSRDDGNGEIVLITMFADINGLIKGKNSKDRNDIRIDLEVVAHTENKSTYSINHESVGTFQRGLSPVGRIPLSIELDAENSAWKRIREIITTPIVTDDGKKLYIMLMGIDEGFGTEYARKFVEEFPLKVAYTMKGDGDTKSTPTLKDAPYCVPMRSYGRGQNVLVNKVKDDVYNHMQLLWNREREQPSHFMNYPKPMGPKYRYSTFFKEYEGEERTITINKKSKEIAFMWQKIGDRANHFWDCRIGNDALADLKCRQVCKEYKLDHDWKTFALIMKSEIYGNAEE